MPPGILTMWIGAVVEPDATGGEVELEPQAASTIATEAVVDSITSMASVRLLVMIVSDLL